MAERVEKGCLAQAESTRDRKLAQRARMRKEMRFERPWSTSEVSAWSGMCERMVLQYARDGVLPGRKVGQVWYFNPKKVAEFFGFEL